MADLIYEQSAGPSSSADWIVHLLCSVLLCSACYMLNPVHRLVEKQRYCNVSRRIALHAKLSPSQADIAMSDWLQTFKAADWKEETDIQCSLLGKIRRWKCCGFRTFQGMSFQTSQFDRKLLGFAESWCSALVSSARWESFLVFSSSEYFFQPRIFRIPNTLQHLTSSPLYLQFQWFHIFVCVTSVSHQLSFYSTTN